MDTINRFVLHSSKYVSGEWVHEEISSLTIKRYMRQLNLWLVPIQLKNWWRISIGLFAYSFSFASLLSGFPLDLYIPDLGKFINIGAGVSMSCGKWLFLYAKHNQFTALMHQLNAKDEELRKRANRDARVKKLRGDFFVQEMSVFLLTTIFSSFFVCAMYVQQLFSDPLKLVVPCKAPFSIVAGSMGFWIVYLLQFLVSFFVAMFISAADIMVGNLYNQLILHLEVLHYDLEELDSDEMVNSAVFSERFRQFTHEYQSIRRVTNACQKCMRPFLINNIVHTLVGVMFCCVEVGIMVNVDITQCLKPVLYFLFLNIPFFYWSWLGNRLREKSSGLALSAFIYKSRASNVATQKLLLSFVHMVQSPLTINARPIYELDFDIFFFVLKTSYKFTTVFKNFYARLQT